MVKLAFYKGKGNLFDRLIRWWTKSPYSHCELIVDGKWYSSSPRDGKVRSTYIIPKPDHWDIFDIPCSSDQKADAKMLFEATEGAGYDWIGILGSQVFPAGIQSSTRWFCSEICSAVLDASGIIELSRSPAWYSPARLYQAIRESSRDRRC